MSDPTAPGKLDRALSAEELKTAYRRLCERLDELDALRPESIQSPADEEPFRAWVERYNLTIDNIYGQGSPQCGRHCISHFSALYRVAPTEGPDYDAGLMRNTYASAIASVRKRIVSILDDHAEKLEALGGAKGTP